MVVWWYCEAAEWWCEVSPTLYVQLVSVVFMFCQYVRDFVSVSVSVYVCVCALLCVSLCWFRSDGPCSDVPLHRLQSRPLDQGGVGNKALQSEQGQQKQQDEVGDKSATQGGNIVHVDSGDETQHHIIKIHR